MDRKKGEGGKEKEREEEVQRGDGERTRAESKSVRETKGREAAAFLTFKLLFHLILRKQSRVSATSPTLHSGRLRLCRLSNMSDAAS